MFLVSDTQEKRHKKLRSLFENDPVIGVILSAIDFEWTVRRAILALGQRPTKEIRQTVLNNCSGLTRYNDAWRKEVYPCRGKTLPQVVERWNDLREAFKLRHTLVHGVNGTTTKEYASERVEIILASSEQVYQFIKGRKKEIFGRRIVRYKERGC